MCISERTDSLNSHPLEGWPAAGVVVGAKLKTKNRRAAEDHNFVDTKLTSEKTSLSPITMLMTRNGIYAVDTMRKLFRLKPIIVSRMYRSYSSATDELSIRSFCNVLLIGECLCYMPLSGF